MALPRITHGDEMHRDPGASPWEEVNATTWRLRTGIVTLTNNDGSVGWLLNANFGYQTAADGWQIEGGDSIIYMDDVQILLLTGATSYVNLDAAYAEIGDGTGLFHTMDGVKHYLAGGAGVVVPLLTADPAGGDSQDGQIYYDTATDKFRGRVNGAWTDLGASHTHVYSEVPAGTVNGVNDTFTVAATPTAGTLRVYKNGLRQKAGAGNDYTLATATITFLAGNLPQTGDTLLADYQS